MKIKDLSFYTEITEEDTANVDGGDNSGATFTTFKPKANIFTFKPSNLRSINKS